MKTKQLFLLVTYAILLAMALLNLDKIFNQIDILLTILNPITNGFVMAYVLNFIMRGAESHLLSFMDRGSPSLQRMRRPVAILVTLSVTFLMIYAIFAVMIPELGSSFNLLRLKAPDMSASFLDYINALLNDLQLNDNFWVEIQRTLTSYTNQMIQLISEGIPKLLSATTNVATAVFDIVIGLIISVYLLSSKEQLLNQLSRMVTTLFKTEWAAQIIYVGNIVSRCFNNYVYVRLLESVIVFAMMVVGMLLLRMPYVALISLVIGVTNLIPVVGPIFGAVPCFFIIAVLDPKQAIIFLLLHTVVQQVEGNIIGPQISGSALGLPGLWVMVSIVIGGGLFGMAGLLVATPLMTVIYEIIREYINERYEQKKT